MAFNALLAALLLMSAGMAQATMYRWVDGNGRVQYSDTPPMTFQQSGGEEMSKQGNIIRRTQSQEERRAEAERLAEQKKIQQEQQKQAQLDRALTQTYTTEAEIDLARDRALEHHKLAIKGAEIRSKTVNANLAELQARIAGIEKADGLIGSDAGVWVEPLTGFSSQLLPFDFSWFSGQKYSDICSLTPAYLYVGSQPYSFQINAITHPNWYELVLDQQDTSIYRIIPCNP